MELSGIVSEHDFQEFCTTMNEHIIAYDAVLAQRQKIVKRHNILGVFYLGMIYNFFFLPAITKSFAFETTNSMRSMVMSWFMTWLVTMAGILLLSALCFVNISMIFKKKIKTVIDEQNEIYRHVYATCVDMSERVTASVTTSSSPEISFTCLLGSLKCNDDFGAYNNMEYITFKLTKEIADGHDETNDPNVPYIYTLHLTYIRP